MKTIICFVLIVTVSVAKDDSVYVYTNRDYYSDKRLAKPKPWSVFRFGYHSGDMLFMQIYLKNMSPNVSADIYIHSYPPGAKQTEKGEKYFQIHQIINFKKIIIELQLSTVAGFCTKYNIVDAKSVTRENTVIDTPYNDICLREVSCVIEVDLVNHICDVPSKPDGPTNDPFKPSVETTTNTSTGSGAESKDQQKLKAVLIYVIPSVIGMCAIILITYISVNKYFHQNLHPIETMELNTYATANEVVYADLSLVHGDSQPPRRDEESPYAKIVGVMKPVPR